MGGSQSDKPSGRKAFPPHTRIWGARETQAPLLSCTGGNATHCGRQGPPPSTAPDVQMSLVHTVAPCITSRLQPGLQGTAWPPFPQQTRRPPGPPHPVHFSCPPLPRPRPQVTSISGTSWSPCFSPHGRGGRCLARAQRQDPHSTHGSRSLQTMACSLCLPSPTLWPQELAGEQCGGPQVSAPGESVLCGALCQVPPPLSPVGSASSPFQQGRWALPTFPAARPSLRGRAQGAPQTQVLVSGLQGLAWPEDRCPPPCLDLTRQSLRTDCPCSTLLWGGAGKDLPRFWQILQPQRKRPWP